MTVWAALSLLSGLLATLAALVRRWALVRSLEPTYLPRFLVTQGVLINGALYGVWHWTLQSSGLNAQWSPPILVVAYGLMYLAYSVANVDWTVKKFHAEG
ncbi:MAG: hypothetical protein VKP62_09145 [Candidatus Sericytochromatia bacterium]|nr:hypothetical protein [Candidatus Sericytochromatia bacterium]